MHTCRTKLNTQNYAYVQNFFYNRNKSSHDQKPYINPYIDLGYAHVAAGIAGISGIASIAGIAGTYYLFL